MYSYKKSFVLLIFCLFVVATLYLCEQKASPDEEQHQSGELEIDEQQSDEDEKAALEAQLLADPSWKDPALSSGNTPGGYSFVPKRDKKMDNYLEVSVGSNTDVVVKLMDHSNDKCIRYVYVMSMDSYKIKNIPQGLYYLKIAYGKNWRQKEVEGRIVGKFLSNPLYEIGKDPLDYNIEYGRRIETDEGYSQEYKIPSFKVSLNVVELSSINSLVTDEISESEFNE